MSRLRSGEWDPSRTRHGAIPIGPASQGLHLSEQDAGPSIPPVPQPRPALTLVEAARPDDDHGRADVTVLTNRIAATLMHHDPGWRLPRMTALARHYNVSTDLIAAAVDELVARRLLRRLPDGRACRRSPAHYVLPLAHQARLHVNTEAIDSDLSLKTWTASWSPVRDDVRRTLGLRPGDLACTLQLLWTAVGEPAAVATTYVTKDLAEAVIAAVRANGSISVIMTLPVQHAGSDGHDAGAVALARPRTLQVEVQQPPPWAARPLGLAACEQAGLITVGYRGPEASTTAALTIAVLRLEALQISIASSDAPVSAAAHGDRAWSAWDHVAADWET
jgi:hypothetical protein